MQKLHKNRAILSTFICRAYMAKTNDTLLEGVSKDRLVPPRPPPLPFLSLPSLFLSLSPSHITLIPLRPAIYINYKKCLPFPLSPTPPPPSSQHATSRAQKCRALSLLFTNRLLQPTICNDDFFILYNA